MTPFTEALAIELVATIAIIVGATVVVNAGAIAAAISAWVQ